MGYNGDKRYAKKERTTKRTRSTGGWLVASRAVLGEFVVTLAEAGNAVLFAGASGDAMLTVSVYSDGDREKYYIRPQDDIHDALFEIVDDYASPLAVEAFSAFLADIAPDKSGKEGIDD